MQDVDLNWIAIVVAALVPMALGALWYGPLFAEPWLRAVGRTREDVSGAQAGYVIAAIGALIMSYSLARIMRWAEVDDLWNGALVGILAWLGFVATVLASVTYFGGRPRELWFINAGYWLVALALMGAVHGVWD